MAGVSPPGPGPRARARVEQLCTELGPYVADSETLAAAANFAAGFVLSTALLHAAGVAIGLGLPTPGGARAGMIAARIAGAATALGGVAFAITG